MNGRAIGKTVEKIKKIKGNRDLFTMGFITDVHTGGNRHVEHLSVFSDAFSALGYQVAVNGGDIGLDLGETREEAERIVAETATNMKQDKVPFLYCKGNHDFGTQMIPNGEMTERLALPAKLAHGDKVTLVRDGDLGGYGYFYDAAHKVKLLFLNTSEGNTRRFTISDAQISWVIRTLAAAEPGERILVTGHFCIHECGEWKSYPLSKEDDCFPALRKILAGFAGKKSGSFGDRYAWDFSGVDASAKLVCYLAGDSHFNNFRAEDGVNYVVRQGYGGVDPKEMPDGATHDRFSANDGMAGETVLFDTLILDGDVCRVIRTGAGEGERDLSFSY